MSHRCLGSLCTVDADGDGDGDGDVCKLIRFAGLAGGFFAGRKEKRVLDFKDVRSSADRSAQGHRVHFHLLNQVPPLRNSQSAMTPLFSR